MKKPNKEPIDFPNTFLSQNNCIPLFVTNIALYNSKKQNKNDADEKLLSSTLTKNAGLLDTECPFYEDMLRITALEYAVMEGNVALMMKLLAAGANPNVGQYRPLQIACRNKLNSQLMISILLNNHLINKKINAKQTHVNAANALENCTPLHIACHFKNAAAIKLLLASPNINVFPKSKRHDQSPLKMALIANEPEYIDLLFEKILQISSPISEDIIKSIEYLLIFEQFEKAISLLNKIIEYKQQKNSPIPEEIRIQLQSLFEFIKEYPVNIPLFEAFIRAADIRLDESFAVHINGRKCIQTLLFWICLFPQDYNDHTEEWTKFLLHIGANPNHIIEDDLAIFQALVHSMSPDILHIFLESGKVSQQYITYAMNLAKLQLNTQKINMLIPYLTENVDTTLTVKGKPLDFNITLALANDDLKEFCTLFNGEVKENAHAILFKAVDFRAQNIMIYLLKSHNPFENTNELGHNLFTMALYKLLLDVVDNIWNKYAILNPVILKSELERSKAHFLLIQQKEKNESMENHFKEIFSKIQTLETKLSQVLERTETPSFHQDSKGNTFFKCMSSTKYIKETHLVLPSNENNHQQTEALIPKPTPVIEPVQHTWFHNKTVELSSYIPIEKTNTESYLVLLKDVDCHPNKVFENLGRYFFDSSCIKKLSNFEASLPCSVAGEIFDCEISHELKSPKTDDRILIAQIPSNEGAATLYIGFKYIKSGLHKEADTKNVYESIKKSKPLELDFLFENTEKIECSFKTTF